MLFGGVIEELRDRLQDIDNTQQSTSDKVATLQRTIEDLQDLVKQVMDTLTRACDHIKKIYSQSRTKS